MFAWWTCLQTVCNRRGKNGAKIGLSVVKSAEDGICHRPMLYQLSYAHQTLIGNSLTLFSYAAFVCMFAIEGSLAISFAWNSGRACIYLRTILSLPWPIQRRIIGSETLFSTKNDTRPCLKA